MRTSVSNLNQTHVFVVWPQVQPGAGSTAGGLGLKAPLPGQGHQKHNKLESDKSHLDQLISTDLYQDVLVNCFQASGGSSRTSIETNLLSEALRAY